MRGDEYGGTLENRLRFPLEVYEAVRRVWPAEKPMSVRISASDWLGEKGMTIADSVHVARVLRDAGLDLIDVSSAGNTPLSQPEYGRMYQVPFAERIRSEVGMAVMAVGAIQGADHVNTLIASGRADLCAIARGHLSDPYLTLRATGEYDHFDHPWPKQYELAQPRPRLEGRRR
jgi:anthraniloyl-CoA monooxygenase